MMDKKYIVDRFLLFAVFCFIVYEGYYLRPKSEGKEIHIHLPPQKKDSIQVKEIKTIQITERTFSNTVTTQAKPDTVLRKEVEKGTVVIGEKTENGTLKIQTLDSSGVKREDNYKLSANETFKVDKNGKVEILEDKKKERKEKLRKAGNRLLDVTLFIVGVFIGRKI